MAHLLAMRFSALGDVAMTVPVVRSFALAYPQHEVTLMSRPMAAPLFEGLPANVHFRPVKVSDYKGVNGLVRLYHELESEGYDGVADLHDVLRTMGAEQVRRLLLHTSAAGRQGADKLRSLAENLETAPAVDGAPVSLSCRVRQVIPLGSHDMFLGEVVAVRVRKDLVDEKGSLHLEKAHLIVYSHGLYQKLGDVMGFFGWSVAREEVRKKRMAQYR